MTTQAINYFTKAAGATPAANHNAGTPQPLQGSKPALNQQTMGIPIYSHSDYTTAAAVVNAAGGWISGDQLVAGDIMVAFCLPKDHELLDVIFETAALDTGANLTLTLAQLKQDFTDIVAGTELFISSTVGQAGGVVRANNVPGMIQASNQSDLWYGLKVVVGAAGVNAGAAIRCIPIYVPTETYSVTLPPALFP